MDTAAQALVPDPAGSTVIRLIFDLYARDRLGARTIANTLSDRGHRTTTGGRWSAHPYDTAACGGQRIDADTIEHAITGALAGFYRHQYALIADAITAGQASHTAAHEGRSAELATTEHVRVMAGLVGPVVGRTHRDANHHLVVVGDPLPVRLRRSRARKML